ncbi:MAG: RNA polymerase sigma factor [Sphingobacteriales bacterium]
MNHCPLNGDEEKKLVEEVLTGNRYAFAKIIKHTERLVTLILFRMVANRADHKDLVQDVYLRAYDKLSTFQFRSRLSTWIGQITYHACLHYLEKKKLVLMEAAFSDTEGASSPLAQISDRTIDPFSKEGETLLVGKELKHILQQAAEELPPVYRTLLSLHQSGMSYEEMVQITGLPEGTVKSYLFRARKNLKEAILSKYRKEDL